MRSLLLCVSVLVSFAVAAVAPQSSATHSLRVTAIPEAREDFQKNEAVFRAWLSQQAGVPVDLRLADSYEEAVRLLASNAADLGWLGGVTTVQVMAKSGGRIRPIVIREKDREFKSLVIAAASLGATSLDGLRGKRFSFGAPSSTSGHVMPRFFMLQKGLIPEKFFASVAYSGDHKKTVLAVASGQQECGAVNYKIFDQMVADKVVDPEKVKIVWTTPAFVDQSWVAARDLDDRAGAGVLAKVTAAFLNLDPARPEDRRVLDILKTNKYIEARTEWWRSVAAALDVIRVDQQP